MCLQRPPLLHHVSATKTEQDTEFHSDNNQESMYSATPLPDDIAPMDEDVNTTSKEHTTEADYDLNCAMPIPIEPPRTMMIALEPPLTAFSRLPSLPKRPPSAPSVRLPERPSRFVPSSSRLHPPPPRIPALLARLSPPFTTDPLLSPPSMLPSTWTTQKTPLPPRRKLNHAVRQTQAQLMLGHHTLGPPPCLDSEFSSGRFPFPEPVIVISGSIDPPSAPSTMCLGWAAQAEFRTAPSRLEQLADIAIADALKNAQLSASAHMSSGSESVPHPNTHPHAAPIVSLEPDCICEPAPEKPAAPPLVRLTKEGLATKRRQYEELSSTLCSLTKKITRMKDEEEKARHMAMVKERVRIALELFCQITSSEVEQENIPELAPPPTGGAA